MDDVDSKHQKLTRRFPLTELIKDLREAIKDSKMRKFVFDKE